MTNNTANSHTGQHTSDRGQIHPRLVVDYKAKTALKFPKQSDANRYGSLTADSPYSEYAWEFLRRNRFYQAMIDNVKPSFNLDDWGYRADLSYPSSCGLTEPYKHYSESYEPNPPDWEPLWAIRTSIEDAMNFKRSGRKVIDCSATQVAFVFDLAPVFGPKFAGLKTQADLAVKCIEEYLSKKQSTTKKDKPAGHYDKSKNLLRRYLRIADLLTYPRDIEPNDSAPTGKPKRETPTIKEAAFLLPDYDFLDEDKSLPSDENRVERTYDYADEAGQFIYKWKCLNLLTFTDEKKKARKKSKMLQKNNIEKLPE